VPVHKDVDALQFFGFGRFALVLRNLNLRVAAVAYGLELAGFLAEVGDDGVGNHCDP
jgi:hypothetical protein